MNLKEEIFLLQKLGNKMGWGHLMALATALWRRELENKYNSNFKSAAFIGVCECSIKKEHLEGIMKEVELYDRIVEKELNGG